MRRSIRSAARSPCPPTDRGWPTWRRAAAGRDCFCGRSIATSRHRSTAPRTPPIRSSRPTASGSASSRTAACRSSASTAARRSCSAPLAPARAPTWAADDTIVFGGGPGGGLARVSARAAAIPSVLADARAPALASFGSAGRTCFPTTAASSSPRSALAGSDVARARSAERRAAPMLADRSGVRTLCADRPRGLRAAGPPRSRAASRSTAWRRPRRAAARPLERRVDGRAMLDGPRFALFSNRLARLRAARSMRRT